MKDIEAYYLLDFCQKVQEAFEEGYRFDFDTNANIPTTYGTMYVCKMVKPKQEVEEKVSTPRGRPKNSPEV